MMNLFTPDLFRNFALGFAVTSAIIGFSAIDEWNHALEAPANAAQLSPAFDHAAQVSDEFVITPLEIAQ